MQLKHIDHQILRRLFKKWFNAGYTNLMEKRYDDHTTALPPDEPPENFTSSPIIVLGMHRSGTSLLIDALTELGLFSGEFTGPDTSEALIFQYLNDAALAVTQSHWSNPENLNYALDNRVIFDCLTTQFRAALNSKWLHLYQAKSPNITLLGSRRQFGWKDPRNCLTVPIWSNLFPNARFVFIHRHGIDVAQSHVNRELRKGHSSYIARCLNLERSFSLWEEYNTQALKYLDKIPTSHVHMLSFENLVKAPHETLKKTAEFCSLSIDQNRISKIASRVKADKAYEYRRSRKDYSYLSFMESTLMTKFGYKL